ncbi:MAG: adenosine deaminase [Treponema sp.]|nr:adenosine deaminase [Treponema sp.]
MKKSEFNTFLAKVPKAELHIHIEAVITLDSVKKLYLKRFGKEMTEDEQTSLFTYNDLNGFIQAFLKVQDLFTSVEDFRLVFDDLGNYLKENGITYCEAFFAPTAFLKKGFKYDEMVKIFHEKIVEIKEKDNITIKLMEDVSRTFGCENAINNYNLQKEFPCEDIIGIGLGGAESKGPAAEYAPVYEMALKDGKHAVIHAGEDVGPESIWDAINLCHAERIGHGLTAMQDEKLMDTLAETKLPIEICITSNTFTKKIVTEAKDHPVKKYFDKGIVVTINTDDPVFFKTTMLEELWLCHDQLGFSMDEIKQLIKYSFTASFLSEDEKKAWCEKVDAAFAS